jgi:hypothetical protein
MTLGELQIISENIWLLGLRTLRCSMQDSAKLNIFRSFQRLGQEPTFAFAAFNAIRIKPKNPVYELGESRLA